MDTEKFKAVYNESRNGCDHFYRHPLAPGFQYSDGVQSLAEAGCYWLLDIIATEIPAVMRKHKAVTAILHVAVTPLNKATLWLSFEDDEAKHPWVRNIEYTDLPVGNWVFEIANDGQRVAMILISEH